MIASPHTRERRSAPHRRPPDAAVAAGDGRVLRAQRSREAIVGALVDLVRGGALEPTAQQVAERAGVGLRSVFRHFSDMESLFGAIGERVFAEAAPLLFGGKPTGGIEQRARDLVERRARFFEHVLPFKRSGNLRRAHSPFLEARHGGLVRQLRLDLLRWLPELERASAAALDAFDLVLSFESWDRLRGDQRLEPEAARAAMLAATLALAASLRARR
jgi:AcrR family transcriptional regulator